MYHDKKQLGFRMCAYANALGPRLSSVVASELLLDLIAVLFALRDQDQVAAKVGDDGALTFMGMSDAPDTTPAKGLSGSDIVITPDGRFVYSGLRGKPADGVAGYAVQDNGMLEPIDRTATDSIPWALGMSPRGDRLFVSASRAGTLTAFKIKDDGSLEKEAILKLGKDFWDILVLDVGAGL